MRRRMIAFGLVLGACVLLGGGWVVVASRESGPATSSARVRVDTAPTVARGELLVRAVDSDDPRLNGAVERVKLGERGATKAGGLACERVYMAAGRGLCLAVAASGVDYRAYVFDRRFRVLHELALEGLPSRARVSRDGRLGAYTTFVTGDSYADPGQFSTRTRILDLRSGEQLADLEDFEAIRAGERIDAPDVNYWGVTFAPGGDRFYATLATGGKRYLVEGSLRARRVEVLRENVECPSLSPDATRIAYKKRVGGVEDWRLHVLELRSRRDVALSERRSIDDQVEWLDDEVVVYGDGRSVWAARADGGGRPSRILSRADSPVRHG